MTLINHNPQIAQRVLEQCDPLLIENGGPIEEINEEPFSGDDAQTIMDRIKPKMPCGFLWSDGATYNDEEHSGLALVIDKTIQYSLLLLIDAETETVKRKEFIYRVSDLFENQIMSRYITNSSFPELNEWTFWQILPLESSVVSVENLFGMLFRFSQRVTSSPTPIPDRND